MQVRESARLWALAGLGALAGFFLFRVWVPAPGARLTACLLRRFAGLPCPGCGMTRAFAHLAKGEWGAAVTDHPLAPVVALEFILGWAAWGTALALGPRFRLPVRIETVLVANAAALCALWLGRIATGTLPW